MWFHLKELVLLMVLFVLLLVEELKTTKKFNLSKLIILHRQILSKTKSFTMIKFGSPRWMQVLEVFNLRIVSIQSYVVVYVQNVAFYDKFLTRIAFRFVTDYCGATQSEIEIVHKWHVCEQFKRLTEERRVEHEVRAEDARVDIVTGLRVERDDSLDGLRFLQPQTWTHPHSLPVPTHVPPRRRATCPVPRGASPSAPPRTSAAWCRARTAGGPRSPPAAAVCRRRGGDPSTYVTPRRWPRWRSRAARFGISARKRGTYRWLTLSGRSSPRGAPIGSSFVRNSISGRSRPLRSCTQLQRCEISVSFTRSLHHNVATFETHALDARTRKLSTSGWLAFPVLSSLGCGLHDGVARDMASTRS